MKHKIEIVNTEYYCTICKGTELELTIDCSGQVLTKKQREQILDGELNFRNEAWFKPRKYFKYGDEK